MAMEDRTATGVTSVRRDWAAAEADAPGTAAELGRLLRRARRRPWRTLGLALAVAALAVAALALRPPSWRSRVVFAVTGGGAEQAHAARVLRDWIAGSVFSDGQLRALIEEHGLHRALAARDSHAAVAALRDDLTVEVGRDGLSAQRLALTLRGDDAGRVQETVAHLGRLVAEARVRAHPPRRIHALHLELVDGGHADAPLVPDLPMRLVLGGLLAFLLALPLVAVAVAAFDPHVYDLDDVRHLGLPTMGAIRDFPGDNAGALVARLGHDRMPPS